MGPHASVTALACIGQLGLVILVTARGPKGPLAAPFAAFTGLLFAWNFASLVYEVTGREAWLHLDYMLSPQATPAALLFVLTYLGQRRRLRPVLLAAYATAGALTLSSLLTWLRLPALALPPWGALHAALVVSVTVFGIWRLFLHLRDAAGEAERLRTRVLIAGLTVLPVLGISEIGNSLWAEVPRLGSLGTLISAALLARVALGLELLGERRSSAVLAYAVLLGVLGLLAYVGLLRWLGPDGGLIAFALATATLVLVSVARQLATAAAERRARMSQFATLGRFSAQMAHDLKNPLAALKGATQFLQEERARGADMVSAGSMLELMGAQIDRIHATIDTYQRLGKVEPALRPAPLDELVRSVCGLQSLAPPAGIRIRQELEPGLPEVRLDPELLGSALENLVRNGLQAMAGGGELTVRLGWGTQVGRARSLVLAVEDTGVGMDPRTRERAFDPFFTTKADGSGMGLAFVRRVIEAHHGSLALQSREGRGTQVRLTLPV